MAELGPLLHADALYVLLDDLLLPLHVGGHGPGLHLAHHPGLLPHHGASLLLLLRPLLSPRLLSCHAPRPHKLLLLSWLLLLLPLPLLLLSLYPSLLLLLPLDPSLLLLSLDPSLLLLLELQLLLMLLQYRWVRLGLLAWHPWPHHDSRLHLWPHLATHRHSHLAWGHARPHNFTWHLACLCLKHLARLGHVACLAVLYGPCL